MNRIQVKVYNSSGIIVSEFWNIHLVESLFHDKRFKGQTRSLTLAIHGLTGSLNFFFWQSF